jgi:hypothetical protein
MAKRAKRKAIKRKVVKKKRSKKTATKSSISNRKTLWAAYRELQKKVDKAWSKLKSNVNRKAKPQVLIRDKNQLLLLLGECNYMARECTRLESKSRHR